MAENELSTQEAAGIIGVSRMTVFRWCKAKKVRCRAIESRFKGKVFLIKASEVERVRKLREDKRRG